MRFALSYGEWIGTISLVVTTAGFGLTIAMLIRTAQASEAAVQAITRTEKRMALNHLLVLLPQFQIFEIELDVAAEDDDRKHAMRALSTYKNVANEIASILENQDTVDSELIDRLRVSAHEAVVAKSELVTRKEEPVGRLTEDVRRELGELSGMITGVAARFKIQVEPS